MQNPFAKDNININSEIHSLMKMNPQQSYIQGFKNCYYQGNQNNNNNQNNNDINKFTIISTYINDNPNDIIFKNQNDSNKFVNLHNIVQPDIYGKNVQFNMIMGGDQQNNVNSNFTMYQNGKKVNFNFPNQFTDNEQNDSNNSQNNNDEPNNYNNINPYPNDNNDNANNNINNNVNYNQELNNNINNINNAPNYNINNDIYKNMFDVENNNNTNNLIDESNKISNQPILPKSEINETGTNIKNPIFNVSNNIINEPQTNLQKEEEEEEKKLKEEEERKKKEEEEKKKKEEEKKKKKEEEEKGQNNIVNMRAALNKDIIEKEKKKKEEEEEERIKKEEEEKKKKEEEERIQKEEEEKNKKEEEKKKKKDEEKKDQNNIVYMRAALNKEIIEKEKKNPKEEEEKKKKEEEIKNLQIQSKYMKAALNQAMYNQEEDEKSEIELEDKKESKKQEPEDKIIIKFIIRGKSDPVEYKTNQDKIFSDVLSNFFNDNKHLSQLLKYEIHSIHNCNIINPERTLRENYIKNGDKILLYWIEMKNNSNSNIEEDDREILNTFLKEYKAIKFCQYQIELKHKMKSNQNNIPKFDIKSNINELISFLLYRANKINSGIKILEHEHELVCCLTNYGWTCKQCKKVYTAQDEKFYCSICDYYMCQACRKLKDYDRRKTIKKDITPNNEVYREKFLNKPELHEHRLIYCITSRNYFGQSVWKCDKCKARGNSWNFYCTLCDSDFCVDCALKKK